MSYITSDGVNKTPFKNLFPGEVFKYGEEFYIKIQTADPDDAVSLKDGRVTPFLGITDVIVVKELVAKF